MSSVRVSVICPTFNRSRAILHTIDSVRAQTVSDWELIVVSDGSTDDTDEWVRTAARDDGRIRLHRTVRHGHPAEPRNVGLALARGEVIAYLDHDDQWRPDHLATVLSAVEDGASMVATGYERRDRDGTCVGVSEPVTYCWHPEIQLMSPLFEPSLMAHLRGLPERVGGWRGGIGMEDWDLYVRLADAGVDVTTVPERTVTLLYDSGTRRYRISRRHRLPLAVFDDARKARLALTALRADEHAPALHAAIVDDLTEWLCRLSETPRFVWPRGWRGDLASEIRRIASSDRLLWTEDFVVVPSNGRYLIAQLLWCATAEHARRISEVAPKIQPRQLDLIARIVADFGGRVCLREGDA